METLKEAFDMASPSFSNLLRSLNPNLLIYDFLQPWAPLVASSQNIPAIQFLTLGAASSSYYYQMCKNLAPVEFAFPSIFLHEYELQKFVRLLHSDPNSFTNKDRFVRCVNESYSIILIKTFSDIEAKYVDYLSSLVGKEVLSVGPLVQEPIGDHTKQSKFIEWLGKKNQSSVVFVSFGSEYFMSKEEMEELAYGLELSMVNFIWVIRFPEGEKIRVHDDGVLPQGFLERIGERGMVVEGWAPQAEILGHSSIGGFVSHCGWSSMMESMKFGVPIIAMPMQLDQPLNARLVVEIGVGMEVKSTTGEGMFEREEVAKVIKEVVVGKEGEVVRRRAKEVSLKMREKGEEEIDIVVEKLLQLCDKSDNKKENLEEQM
ncbi:UDP-glucuronosyl/UDP-glucosyltransferase [Macleaya cordata]|uniref:UDP-glucuronosyl/UDP-glucosyltransferase n=1 Tax=Macleaya cordata TaxID=56857 RepID=A0A200Q687_MACCD|nr:UDP-glucuronosyl/UDP-glucosyltransferase [Macleaya cordata]